MDRKRYIKNTIYKYRWKFVNKSIIEGSFKPEIMEGILLEEKMVSGNVNIMCGIKNFKNAIVVEKQKLYFRK